MLGLLLTLGGIEDTIRVAMPEHPPVFDGRASEAEWGAPAHVIQRPGGSARLWVGRVEGSVYIAAKIEDSTYYWGDDLVISLDTQGDRSRAPNHDDFQWYLRRMPDSSVVSRGQSDTWQAPRGDPDWRLGKAREGGGWEVRIQNDSVGWSVELKLDEAYFLAAKPGALPGIAFRIYDDSPSGWYTWPVVPEAVQPRMVERRPDWWMSVELEGSP